MSDNKDIKELKSEIAGYYLDELKIELGRLKALTLLPIKNKVKNIIMGYGDFPEKFKEIKEFGFWKDIINFITPSTSEQIYEFIKEKREKLVNKTTKEDLQKLRDEILGNLNDDRKDDDKQKGVALNYENKLDKKYVYGNDLTDIQLDMMGKIMNQRYPGTPLNVNMIKNACKRFSLVPCEYLLAFMQNDSGFGTNGNRAIDNHNPGNVGNTDGGENRYFKTRQAGVDACAENLQHRIHKYFEFSANNNGSGFNEFPTPYELATGKSEGGINFFGVYMTAKDGPSKVASFVNDWNRDLKA